jgi:Skp family chaperone for outer membrane proteins
MGDDYYKAKYKAVKKELRKVRTEMEELRQSLQLKLDQTERERDELAEKIDQDFRKKKNSIDVSFFS